MVGLAYLLPGQGAQAPGMGKAFYDTSTSSREIYKHANTRLGYDLTALCFEGPAEELTKTEKCQPALFVTSFAAFAALMELAPSLKPVAAAGLSLGELTALAVANVFTFSDALYLVQARADAMAECTAHHKGSMLAVMGLAGDALKALCDASRAVVANYNTQEQVVLSGTMEAIDTAERLAKDKGAKRAIRLDVAGAFHSPLMQPAADAFKQAVAKIAIRPPAIPVISNVTAQPVRDPEQIRELLVKQIVSPVLWEPSVRTLIHAGTTHTLEFPPARVLTGMVRKIDPAIKTVAVDEPKDFEKLSDVIGLRSTTP
ncbi:MAG: ACP S-malonyltransferase [Candidatus Omnitrophica bacterium]|nr:ACP S-malonyltransferase [Candidatus Omnitrophota bacterium]